MPELLIQCPGQPDQVVGLGKKAVSIGRGERCDAFIAEKKASRTHLKVRGLEDGGAVAEDQGSSNGTWFVPARGGPRRFLRRALVEGEELRIGDTRILLRASSEPATERRALVSGSLTLVSASIEEPGGAEEPPPEPDAAPALGRGPERAPAYERAVEDGRGRGRMPALAFLAAAVALLVGVELHLGPRAEKSAARKAAQLDAQRVLENIDAGAERFAKLRDEYAARHPDSTLLGTLDRYADRLRERERRDAEVEAKLASLIARIEASDESEVRRELETLRIELPGDESFARRIDGAIAGLDRRRADEDLDRLAEIEREAKRLVGAGRPAQAVHLVDAFENAHPGMDGAVRERWRALEAKAAKAARETFEATWARAGEEKDAHVRNRMLAEAWSALAGTPYGARIGDRLRSAAAMAGPRAGAPAGTPAAPGQPTAPAVPTRTMALLAKAKKAETMLLERHWMPARALLAELVAEVDAGSLEKEWSNRLAEVDQIIGLVRTLAEQTDGEKKPKRKLSIGTRTVVAASPTEVTLEDRKGGSQVIAWGDLTPPDVLLLLTPRRIEDADRHAVALLAASVGERQAVVDVLVPLYEKGGDLGLTDVLVARHLYGRPAAPEGGYRHHKGEILDTTTYERRVDQERIAFLRQEADRVLALVAKEPAFKKLERMRELREDLDKRRRHALVAIFNTTHYPYPVDKGGRAYAIVQREIDRRVQQVQEIWDSPLKVRVKRAKQLDKHLTAWEGVIDELARREVDVSDLKKAMEPYVLYVTDEAITIRDFFRHADERDWMAYNHWVLTRYNPARREEAEEREWRQVQITNEYRMMMGYHAVVQPGPGSFEAIDGDSVVKILDAGKVLKIAPLRAVRIDNHLVKAARLHSLDMGKRGFFAHQAPPNPATGEGPTMPADRMRKQGYQGFGYSENIAMASDPQTAHTMWCHSSGHHRNILSGWTDLGSGVAGKGFTQNFGTGGGGRPEIQPDTSIRERERGGRGGRRVPGGQ